MFSQIFHFERPHIFVFHAINFDCEKPCLQKHLTQSKRENITARFFFPVFPFFYFFIGGKNGKKSLRGKKHISPLNFSTSPRLHTSNSTTHSTTDGLFTSSVLVISHHNMHALVTSCPQALLLSILLKFAKFYILHPAHARTRARAHTQMIAMLEGQLH